MSPSNICCIVLQLASCALPLIYFVSSVDDNSGNTASSSRTFRRLWGITGDLLVGSTVFEVVSEEIGYAFIVVLVYK